MRTENLHWLATKGITLTGYHGVTHPSQPNYLAAIGGDYFGMQNDDFNMVDANISTVIDLLEQKGISWGEYQEDMPYSGFQGDGWVNQENGKEDYVRKHNPAVIYNANGGREDRLEYMKNMTMFYEDLRNDALPQWMFVTPNMTSDAHDSDIATAGRWTRSFLEPLLEDPKFMRNTLVLVTFDENEEFQIPNRVFSILLGDAVPPALVGTTDANYYNHYSEIATVEANWDLYSLGRFDVGANIFEFVAAQTGDAAPRAWNANAEGGQSSYTVEPLEDTYFNASYGGVFNTWGGNRRYPAPNLNLPAPARPVLPSIVEAWSGSSAPNYYDGRLEIPDGQHPPADYVPLAFGVPNDELNL